MYGWTDEMRNNAATLMRDVSTEADALFARARAMISDPASADIGSLLRAYVEGVGSYVDVAFYRLRQLTDELGYVSGQLPAGQSFFNANWSVDTDILQRFCPDTIDSMFEARTNSAVEAAELLEWCPNECMDVAWPTALAGFMRLPRRLPFRAYSTDDAVAYVHPFRYQILSRDLGAMWNTASPRSLSRKFLPETATVETDRAVVIIQDRFGFGNFCHYLFDGITRVLHYVDHFGYQDEIFVFAGVPGRYHEIVGQALCEVTRIPATSLYFPDRGLLLKGARKCVWFSDQKELHSHPAQMAHPQSLGMLSALADLVPGTPSTAKRLYISRGDADRRRITNEAELIRALEARGFLSVQLGKIPVEEQVGLFRNAEVIVGPHGMGLTHIAMGKNIGRVIELFHPEAGTNAYALVARSAGMHYDYALGQGIPATHSDFAMSVDRVLDLLGPEGTAHPRPSWRKHANLIPASRSFHRFVGGSPDPDPEWTETDFSPMIANQSVRFHRKAGPAGNTLVGQWLNVDVAPVTLYVLSCWIWLPERCPTNEVSVRFGGWKAEQRQYADLARAKTWQRISFTAISPKDARHASAGLHLVGHEGAKLASTCWQMERGLMPSAYLATH